MIGVLCSSVGDLSVCRLLMLIVANCPCYVTFLLFIDWWSQCDVVAVVLIVDHNNGHDYILSNTITDRHLADDISVHILPAKSGFANRSLNR